MRVFFPAGPSIPPQRRSTTTADFGGAEPAEALAKRTRWGDRGVSMLEFAGFLPILLVVGMAAIQLGLIGYGINQAGSGARAAARVASQDGNGAAAGRAAVSGWLNPEVDAPQGADTTTATVTVTVPSVIPFMGSRPVTRRATMPNDQDD